MILRPYFFNTWFTDFFSPNKVGGGKKIKIKITKKFFLLNLNYLDRREKNNKNCMILHCKNAEMAIFYFFLKINLADFDIRGNKKSQKNIYLFF